MARQAWTSRLAYILTVAGAAIGFGATRRFPYPVGQNGGAYVMTFIILHVFGRRAQSNCVDAFLVPVKGKKVNPLWRCVGYASLLGSFGILAYCMAIGGRAISCIVNILRGAAGVGSLDLSAEVGKKITQSFYEESI